MRIFLSFVAALALGTTPVLAQSDLGDEAWVAYEISNLRLAGSIRPTIVFPEPGRVSVFSGCNRYMGPVVVEGTKLAFPPTLAGTLMACPPEQERLQKQVLNVLPMVRSYLLRDGILSLLNDKGVAVMRLSQE